MIHRFGARSHRKHRRGAAAVEFAVVAPILILLVFGMLEIGRALMVQHLLTTAVRDGARSATLEGVTSEEVESQVATYLAASSVPNVTVRVTDDLETENPGSSVNLQNIEPGEAVRVFASVPFESVNWLPSSFFMAGQTLRANVVMRREASTSTYSGP